MRNIRIIPAGKDYIYLNSQNGVCGLLKCMDDKIVDKDTKTREKRTSKFSMVHVKTKFKGGD